MRVSHEVTRFSAGAGDGARGACRAITGSASAIFNLSDYRVLDAVKADDGVRRVVVESTALPGCPVCGTLAGRVHSRRRQRLRDLPDAGPTEVVWVKRRWFCDQARCPRGTFSEVTDQVPAYARSTARLCDPPADHARAVADVCCPGVVRGSPR